MQLGHNRCQHARETSEHLADQRAQSAPDMDITVANTAVKEVSFLALVVSADALLKMNALHVKVLLLVQELAQNACAATARSQLRGDEEAAAPGRVDGTYRTTIEQL